MIVTVERAPEWPAQEMAVEFMGHSLFLRPPARDAAPDVRLQYNHPEQEREAFEVICRFLSMLSWWRRHPAKARLRIACTAPMRGGKGRYGPPLQKEYQAPQLTLPDDKKARLALALYREARCVESTPYEFLGYFKVINVLCSKGQAQIDWINATVPKLTEFQAKRRISELGATVADMGDYLYHSGRCAVAHAGVDPIVDPDNPDDVFRLIADMPVARALAEYLIEHELGVRWMWSE